MPVASGDEFSDIMKKLVPHITVVAVLAALVSTVLPAGLQGNEQALRGRRLIFS